MKTYRLFDLGRKASAWGGGVSSVDRRFAGLAD